MQKLRSGRLTDSQKIERLTQEVQGLKAMLANLLQQQNVVIMKEKHAAGQKSETDRNSRKFSMDSLTHQFSLEDSLPTDETDDAQLIEKSSSPCMAGTSIFSTAPNRKVSKVSTSGLSFIQEEEGSSEKAESTDLDSYGTLSGDSNI